MNALDFFYDIKYDDISDNKYTLESEISSYMESIHSNGTFINDTEIFSSIEYKMRNLIDNCRIMYYDIQLDPHIHDINISHFHIKMQKYNENEVIILNMCIRYG